MEVRQLDPTGARGGVIVHSWDVEASHHARENPGNRIPKAFVTRESKGLRLAPEATPGWYRIQLQEDAFGIDVHGDLLPPDLKAVAIYAMEFEGMIRRAIGGRPPHHPYLIRINKTQKEFRQYATSRDAANAMSFYDPRIYEMALWFDDTITHDKLQELLAHEFTHAYMDLVWDRTSPLWFAEGMAEYFQHFQWDGKEAVGGGKNDEQLRTLRMDGTVPLDRFVITPREVMYSSAFPQLYAQAWTVVHFLFEHHPEMVLELLKGRRIDVTGLEAGWKEHLKTL